MTVSEDYPAGYELTFGKYAKSAMNTVKSFLYTVPYTLFKIAPYRELKAARFQKQTRAASE